jgi:DNA polymerase I-like protein with 3'-5' exonuclease and polymerase domains
VNDLPEHYYDFSKCSNALRQSQTAAEMNMERFGKFLKRLRELEASEGLKLTMPIHDEIILEFPEGMSEERKKVIQDELFGMLSEKT